VDRDAVLEAVESLIENEDAAADMLIDRLRERDGQIGLLLRVLRRRPEVFVPHVMQGAHLYSAPKAIDPKTAELTAVAAAAALMCEHCLEAHMRAARRKGATLEEIFDVLLIAGAIAESSTLSVAFRKFRQLEGNEGRTEGGAS
jgi:4-carboxymuconolactone decarboxylase